MKYRKHISLVLVVLMMLGFNSIGFSFIGNPRSVSAMPATDDGEPQDVTLEVSVPTNCRSGPGMPYDIVTVLHTETTIKVIAQHETDDFWLIENPDGCGESCWVWGYYATLSGSEDSLPKEEAPPLPTDVTLNVSVPTNCRVGPGKAYDITCVLHTGKTVDVIGQHESGDYWLIDHPDGCETPCWVWGFFATLTGPAACLPEEEIPIIPAEVTLEVSIPTNCRVGPGKSYDILSVLHTGKTVNVLGRDKTGYYWMVENPEGEGTCWVWDYYATLTGQASCLPIEEPPTY